MGRSSRSTRLPLRIGPRGICHVGSRLVRNPVELLSHERLERGTVHRIGRLDHRDLVIAGPEAENREPRLDVASGVVLPACAAVPRLRPHAHRVDPNRSRISTAYTAMYHTHLYIDHPSSYVVV